MYSVQHPYFECVVLCRKLLSTAFVTLLRGSIPTGSRCGGTEEKVAFSSNTVVACCLQIGLTVLYLMVVAKTRPFRTCVVVVVWCLSLSLSLSPPPQPHPWCGHVQHHCTRVAITKQVAQAGAGPQRRCGLCTLCAPHTELFLFNLTCFDMLLCSCICCSST